jgi:putative salt-induced outer membrane protein YdiY
MPRLISPRHGLPKGLAIGLLLFVILADAGGAQAPDQAPAQASDPDPASDPVRWRNRTEFSLVITGGNASASTVGLQNTLRRRSERGEWRFDVATIRTDATRITRRAVGSADAFSIVTERDTERTSERVRTQLRKDIHLSERTFAYGSVGWDRNLFAGFRSRAVTALGGGTRLEAPDRWTLKLGSALTYTVEDDVDPDPERPARFAGLRGTLDHSHQLSAGTSLELEWVVDANARAWRDTRANLTQGVAATLSERLALKTTLQLLLVNDPPSVRVPLFTPAAEPTSTSVLTPLGKVDRSLSVALVVTL